MIGLNSTRRVRNSTATPVEIARTLGVRALITGSVARAGDRVTINAAARSMARMDAQSGVRPTSALPVTLLAAERRGVGHRASDTAPAATGGS